MSASSEDSRSSIGVRTGPRYIIFPCNVLLKDTRYYPEDTVYLTIKRYQDDETATLGRLFLLLILSDLIVIDLGGTQFDELIWVLDRGAVEDCHIAFLGSKKKTEQLYKSVGYVVGKSDKKLVRWYIENQHCLVRKKVKCNSKDPLFRNAIAHYLTTKLDTDQKMKELYWYEPRVRDVIDSMRYPVKEKKLGRGLLKKSSKDKKKDKKKKKNK